MAMPTKDLTNSLIKEVAVDAMVIRNTAQTDLNQIVQTGVYLLNGKTLQNSPNSGIFYGMLKVTNAFSKSSSSEGYVLQELISADGATYRRLLWYKAWTPWRRTTFTATS